MFTTLLLYMQGIVHILPLIPNAHLSASVACPTNAGLVDISDTINKVVGALTALGGSVCALGIVVGGIMRATSFGNERRISDSNTAITCAVVGLLVVVLAQALSGWLNGIILC